MNDTQDSLTRLLTVLFTTGNSSLFLLVYCRVPSPAFRVAVHKTRRPSSSFLVYSVRLRRGLISCETKAALVPQDCRSRSTSGEAMAASWTGKFGRLA